MTLPDKILTFITSTEESLSNKLFISITLGNYKGTEENLKNIYIKKTIIKSEEKLSFTYRYKTKDIVKNFSIKEGIEQIQIALQNGFKFATLFTTGADIILEQQKNDGYLLKEIAASKSELPSLSHDKIKNHPIAAKGKPYLTELKITDTNGNVFKATQDKYKQINHYIEILSSLLKELPEKEVLSVVDMGSGKGYLTFALYDYLTNVLNKRTTVIGVEFRKDLVNLCNNIAAKSNFSNLIFEEGSIEKYQNNAIDILIALHACDTATDDAIAKGISANASLIVVAPCCHKQIRREIVKHKHTNDIDFITKHGIFLERQAEMVTDAIRAMVLEYFGYKTKVFEFITDAHTPKNIMIVGIKSKVTIDKEAVLQKIKDAKSFFGIQQHYLEKVVLL